MGRFRRITRRIRNATRPTRKFISKGSRGALTILGRANAASGGLLGTALMAATAANPAIGVGAAGTMAALTAGAALHE
jgi:hypothetical protein